MHLPYAFHRDDYMPARESVNSKLAVWITNGVGTMWCAYAFAALALVSLPAAIYSGNAVVLVAWLSQTFLQLVLLSVIIVGQNIIQAKSDAKADADHENITRILDILSRHE